MNIHNSIVKIHPKEYILQVLATIFDFISNEKRKMKQRKIWAELQQNYNIGKNEAQTLSFLELLVGKRS